MSAALFDGNYQDAEIRLRTFEPMAVALCP